MCNLVYHVVHVKVKLLSLNDASHLMFTTAKPDNVIQFNEAHFFPTFKRANASCHSNNNNNNNYRVVLSTNQAIAAALCFLLVSAVLGS